MTAVSPQWPQYYRRDHSNTAVTTVSPQWPQYHRSDHINTTVTPQWPQYYHSAVTITKYRHSDHNSDHWFDLEHTECHGFDFVGLQIRETLGLYLHSNWDAPSQTSYDRASRRHQFYLQADSDILSICFVCSDTGSIYSHFDEIDSICWDTMAILYVFIQMYRSKL